jgi:hypothetical protein
MRSTFGKELPRHWHRGFRVLPLLAAFFLCTLGADVSAPPANPPHSPAFKEIWAYLMRGDEKQLTGKEPITSLCYFGASLNTEGRIPGAVARPVIPPDNVSKPKIFLVVAELSNFSLMHFSLDPEYGVTPLLVADICRVSEPFDGVQIDFEAVSRDDSEYFFGFLAELRVRLPAGKTLSVAVPARTKLVSDAYDYTRIAPLVDRLVIMAYDEHWSGSSPGPVASLAWCAKVADYATSAIDNGKIVMGLPLYGRAWQDKKLARALRYEAVQDLAAEKSSQTSYTSDLGAYFEYSESVLVKVFYDDIRSLIEKLNLYRARDIGSVSFWRIGQGPPELWTSIETVDSTSAPASAGQSQTLPLHFRAIDPQ